MTKYVEIIYDIIKRTKCFKREMIIMEAKARYGEENIDEDSIDKLLKRLVKNGVLKRVRQGYYCTE